jgi:hypothetical protein
MPQPAKHGARNSYPLLVLFLAAMALVNIAVFGAQVRYVREGYSDFMHFYTTGQLVRSGHAAYVYDAAAQLALQKQISRPVREGGVPIAYMHPPFEALLFAPFAALPYFQAYVAWTLVSLAVLFAVTWRLRSELPDLRRTPTLSLVLPLAFYPVINGLGEGQDDILLLSLCAFSFLALRRRAHLTAGVLLAVSLIRPQFALPLLVIVVAGSSLAVAMRILAGFLTASLALVAISAASFGWSVLVIYPHAVLAAENGDYVSRALLPHMPNLHGLIASLVAVPGFATLLIAVPSLAVLITAVLAWRRSRSLDLAFSMAVIAVLLAAYHSFVHDLTLLLLPLLLQANWWLVRPRSVPRWVAASILVPAVILFIPPLSLALVLRHQFHWYALALLAWLAASLRLATTVHGDHETLKL